AISKAITGVFIMSPIGPGSVPSRSLLRANRKIRARRAPGPVWCRARRPIIAQRSILARNRIVQNLSPNVAVDILADDPVSEHDGAAVIVAIDGAASRRGIGLVVALHLTSLAGRKCRR